MPPQSLVLRWWSVLAAAAACAILTIVVATTVLPDGSTNLDEVAYEAQGKAIVAGRLTLPAEEVLPSFRPYLSGIDGGKVIFKYQPLWPALIGASFKLFGTTLVLRALVSFAGVLAAAWFTHELLRTRRAAVFAAVLFAATPLVWLQSATLLGYFPSLVLLLGASAALVRAASSHTLGAAVAAGALIGASVLHRPFDAVVATVPVIVYALLTAGRVNLVRLVGGLALGGLPFLVVLLAYNTAVMGAPLSFPFDTGGGIDRFGFGWRASFVVEGTGRDGQVDYTPSLAVSAAASSLAAFPMFMLAAPAVLGAAVVGAWNNRRDRRVWLLLGSAASLVVGYLFWWGTANAVSFGLHHALGPLYHLPLLISILTLAAWTLDQHWDARRTWLLAGVGVLLLVNAPLNLVANRNASRGGTDRAGEIASFAGSSPRVVIAPPGFPRDPYIRWPNDARLEGDLVVAVDVESDRMSIVERFPDRAVILLKEYRTLGDLFGPTRRARVEVEAVRGPRVEIDVAPRSAPPEGSRAYLRVGDAVRVSDGPTGRFTVDAADLADAPAVETGLFTAAPGTDASAMVGDRLGCRLLGRAQDGMVTLLTPCEFWHHYLFPDEKEADSLEDLSGVLQVEVRAAG